MSKHLLIACILSSVLLGGADALAEDAPLNDCDKYAASKFDPLHKGPGVSSEQIDPRLAIPACEAAVRKHGRIIRLIYQLGRAYQKADKFDAAMKLYREAADHGYAAAQNSIGYMYRKGMGVSQNYSEALVWFFKAADRGHPGAQLDIGYMYENGFGVPQDYSQAVTWYHKAADQGFGEAQTSIGYMYENGLGVPRDYSQAVTWYRRAAVQGNPRGQANLGVAYEKGLGVPRDYSQAVVWYRKAADQGYGIAQYNLGAMYLKGLGVPEDYSRALTLLRKAADQGYANAQYTIGLMYENGLGLPKSSQTAIGWYRQAANNGLREAKEKLNPAGTAQDHNPAVGQRAALTTEDEDRIFERRAELSAKYNSVTADPTLTSFQMNTIIHQIFDEQKSLEPPANTLVRDWTCTVIDVTGGNPAALAEITCQYKAQTLNLRLKGGDPRLMEMRKGSLVRFDGRIFCGGTGIETCFPTRLDLQAIRSEPPKDGGDHQTLVSRDPADAVAMVLNYTVFGNDDGFDDSYWFQEPGSKCRYRLHLAGQKRSNNKLDLFRTILGMNAALMQRQAIDFEELDPRNITFLHDDNATLWGENGVGTIVRYLNEPLFFYAGTLDLNRLERGWTLIYKTYCTGKHQPF